jgi:5-methylcytosine-specific restriction endonuclease McrA
MKCDYCSKKFIGKKKKQKYCSLQCYRKDIKGKNTGKDSHRWNSIKKNCKYCGKKMYVQRMLVSRKKYCSRRCADKGKFGVSINSGPPKGSTPWNKGLKGVMKPWNKGMKGYLRGEKHYNWKGGMAREGYGDEWKEVLIESIRVRDNYICKECGIHQDELVGRIRKLDVHHIDYDKNNCSPENLVSLCRSCHMKTNYNREYWINYFNK